MLAEHSSIYVCFNSARAFEQQQPQIWEQRCFSLQSLQTPAVLTRQFVDDFSLAKGAMTLQVPAVWTETIVKLEVSCCFWAPHLYKACRSCEALGALFYCSA